MTVKRLIKCLEQLDKEAFVMHDLEEGQALVWDVSTWYKANGVVFPTRAEAKEAGGDIEKVVLLR